MPTWDPTQYLRFDDHRTRPGGELLARIGADSPRLIVDLGCGPGTLTARLVDRWPSATITGVDTSEAMLRRARTELPGQTFMNADIASWQPAGPVDVLYSNATLHWVGDHAGLFPRLVATLAEGGWFAVQMPANFAEPTHRLLRELASGAAWSADPSGALRHDVVQTPGWYLDLLGPILAEVDVWETVYHQVLRGDDPVLEWTRGSALRPVLDVLDDDEGRRFEARYAAALRSAYPRRADGTTVLPFRRLFIVGRLSASR